ncbi:MAG: PKD domain-containing protein, partial [Gammaproteobacteria bacterium]
MTKKSSPVYDHAKRESHADVEIENSSKRTFRGTVRLVIDSISDDDVKVANPDGKLRDGRPYFNYRHKSRHKDIKPGEKSFKRKIRFHNPRGSKFDFKVKVEGRCKEKGDTNRRPVANAGPDQTASVSDTVYLDGSASSDADGDNLTYLWKLKDIPPGSAAVLSDPTAVNPSFVVDVAGTYSVKLIVNDGEIYSKPDIVNITTENSPPVAVAGPDQTALIGDFVALDGSGSSDVDGDPLIYTWSLSSVPVGSAAVLSDPATVTPSFVVDLPGTYTVQLIVNDGMVNSTPDMVVVSTDNSAPIADAGPDQTAPVGETVRLDGSGSNDADGDSLTYSWALTSVPDGSTAMLSDETAVNPAFDIDMPGAYVAQLIVNDGMVDSVADSVRITTENTPPVANAGPNQNISVGDTVTLDGSNSSDVDGDLLTFNWSFTSLPPESTAVLSDNTAVMPLFDVDVFGTYVLQLIVNDGTVNSVADTVTVVTDNTAPVANAGPDQTVLVGDAVTLDASSSSDADGDVLTYTWTFVSKPVDSAATLSDSGAVNPAFFVDEPGSYVLQLVVNDGIINSAPDTITITTENSPPVANAGTDQSVLVGDTVILDGGDSNDVDGDALTYVWSIVSMPSGSSATLSDNTIVNPAFEVDAAGTYVVQLIVNDGTVNSAPDSVVVITVNRPPVANAGADRNASVGLAVDLDGTASSDPDGDPLSYAWNLISSPSASNATLTNETSAAPTLIPDVMGVYEIQLVVSDAQFDSDPDTVMVTAGNEAPIANAGPDQTVNLGNTVTLDGSGSSDPDGHSLSYSWSMASRPAGSNATLSDETIVDPTFVADVMGDYELELVVSDGYDDSSVSTVTITASQAAITLSLIDTALVGVGRPAQVGVTLSSPAPAGGVTVTVTSDNAGVLAVESPGTTFITEGSARGEVTVTGFAEGSTVLHGNATGFEEGTLEVGVTLNLISVPTTLNVPLGQTVSFPISIAPDPAPPGGITVSLVSNDSGTAQLDSTTVIIPEGAHSINTAITGHAAGTVTVNASNPDYAADFASVSVTAELNVVPTSVAFSAGFPADVTVRLQSSGSDAAAPVPVTVALTPADPQCVSVTSPVTINPGFVTATATVSYQGTAALPCNTTVLVSAPNITSDTVDVTVNPSPELSFNYGTTIVGAGLMLADNSNGVVLETANHGGVTVRVQSSDPTVALVAPDTNTAGTEYIDVFVPDGTNSFYFVAQGFEGADVPAAATFTASAPGFNSGTAIVNVVQPGLRIDALQTSTTTLSGLDTFTVDVGIPVSGNSNINVQRVRSGGSAVTAVVASSVASVGQLVTAEGSGMSVAVDIQPGTSSSPITIAAGGVGFEPLDAGQTSVSVATPGYITTSAGSIDVTVTAPELGFY